MNAESFQSPRPWPIAGLYGALVPLLFGVTVVVGWIAVQQLDGGEIAVAPLAAIPLLVAFLIQGSLVAFPAAFSLIGLMALFERRSPKPLALWLLLSLIVTTPFAGFVWLVSHMGDCFDEKCRAISEWRMSAPALIVYACGMLGAVVARRVRHGVWA